MDFKKVRIVVGYESACLRIFKKAKAAGCLCVLDAASIHHKTQDLYIEPAASAAFHQFVIRRKDEEATLADYILTASSLAQISYSRNEENRLDKVLAFPLGADVDFYMPEIQSRPAAKFVFLFSGSVRYIKGTDLLLAAMKRISNYNDDFIVLFAGGNGDSLKSESHTDLRKFIKVLGHLSPSELRQIYRQADCLILPSRFDSYGMVVPEALACGVPVIVSDRVGAKDMIRHGINGWIVPAESTEALAERMLWCLEHREQVKNMAAECRNTAVLNSWVVYRSKVGRWFESLSI